MDNKTQIEVILGNSNSRFSGVTSTMLRVLEYHKDEINIAVLGKHHLPEGIKSLSFLSLKQYGIFLFSSDFDHSKK